MVYKSSLGENTMDITVIVGLIGPLLGGAVVWAWNKFGKPIMEKLGKFELLRDIFDALKDGELTEEEANKLIEDIKKIVRKPSAV
jgi:hypothetical protein